MISPPLLQQLKDAVKRAHFWANIAVFSFIMSTFVCGKGSPVPPYSYLVHSASLLVHETDAPERPSAKGTNIARG